jgi:hypothetical protein
MLPIGCVPVHAGGGGCTSGQWTVMSSPAVGNGYLNGVAAVSATDVWAGGQVLGLATTQPLLEHWDGGSWSVVSSPIVPNGSINAIAAASSNDVWALGSAASDTPLIEHWDGYRWKVVPTGSLPPSVLRSGFALNGHDAWAAAVTPDGRGILVEHWNGLAWSVVAAFPGLNADGLAAIAGTGDNDVWVVYPSESEHWDGSTWTHANLALNASGAPSFPYGVADTGGGEAWTAGEAGSATGTVPDVQHSVAGAWSDASLPALSSDALFFSISAASPGDIWAVGSTLGASSPVGMHFDGTQWTSIPPVSPTTQGTSPNAVAALPGQAFAVGISGTGTGVQPLIETYCA